ncbi:MAG: hypothetical protein AAF642_05010, partial [Pseudomonadota bacterium]
MRTDLMMAGGLAIFVAGCVQTDAITAAAEPAVEAATEAVTEATGMADTGERTTEGNLVMENIPDIPASVRERLRQYQNVRGHGFSDWT